MKATKQILSVLLILAGVSVPLYAERLREVTIDPMAVAKLYVHVGLRLMDSEKHDQKKNSK